MATNATLDYTTLAAVLNQTFQEPLQNLIVRSNPILNAIAKPRMGTSHILVKNISGSTRSVGPVADRAVITTAATDKINFSDGSLQWATYRATFQLPSRAVAAVSGQPGALGKLFETELVEAGKDLADSIAKDLLNGSVANGLVGIRSAISSTGTYAGIDRSVVTPWQSVEVDGQLNATTAGQLSTAVLRTLDTQYFNANGMGLQDRSTMIGFTSPELYAKYTQFMENANLASLTTAFFRNTTLSELGVTNVGFMGIPIKRSRELSTTYNAAATTGDIAGSQRLYFMDFAEMYLAVLDPTLDPELIQVQNIQGISAGVDSDGLPVEIQILGKRGEMIEGYLRTYIQFVVPNPKKAGCVIKNLSATL